MMELNIGSLCKSTFIQKYFFSILHRNFVGQLMIFTHLGVDSA